MSKFGLQGWSGERTLVCGYVEDMKIKVIGLTEVISKDDFSFQVKHRDGSAVKSHP